MKRLLSLLQGVLPLAFLVGALGILLRQIRHIDWREVLAYVRSLGSGDIALAILASAAAYLILTLYDFAGARYAGSKIPWTTVAPASFIAWAFSNSMGHPLVTAAPIRLRYYSIAGLDGLGIAKIVTYCLGGFWLGFAMLGGVTLTFAPPAMLATLPLPAILSRALGVSLLALLIAYFVATVTVRRALTIRGWSFHLPTVGNAAAQLAIAIADWSLAATVLYLVFPRDTHVPLAYFFASYLLASATGLLSGVPGGVGVFETMMVVAMDGRVPSPTVLGALVVFRSVYYVAPLVAAASLLAWTEIRFQQHRITRGFETLDRVAPEFVPGALSILAFTTGAILLVGGATPSPKPELLWLAGHVGLPGVEIAHLVTSLIGAGLLVLTRGLQHRLTFAWRVTAWMSAAAVLSTLVRGLDWGSALLCALLLGTLFATKREFYRHSRMSEAVITSKWATTVLMAFAIVVSVTLIAHARAHPNLAMVSSFGLHDDAARSLRALFGVGIVALSASWSLVRGSRLRVPLAPTPADREDVRRIVARFPLTYAQIALLGEKRFLFDSARKGFLMFRVERRSWVSMGDPVATAEVADDLAWTFRDLAAQQGGWAVFYQIREENIPRYVGLGLGVLKIGEEARVRLASFDLDAPALHPIREAIGLLEADGVRFEIVAPGETAPLIPALRSVAQAWWKSRQREVTRTMAGVFDPGYFDRGPLVVAREGDEIVAFANLWLAADKEEASLDLIRFRPELPDAILLALVAHLGRWAASEGFVWLSLGISPHAGVEPTRRSPLWNRAVNVLYRHREHFAGFASLRAFCNAFGPVWEGRYMASPSDLRLATVLRDISRLVSAALKESEPPQSA